MGYKKGIKSMEMGMLDTRLLRKAAEQGEVDAQFNLGFAYGKGQGVPQDYTEAGRRVDQDSEFFL